MRKPHDTTKASDKFRVAERRKRVAAGLARKPPMSVTGMAKAFGVSVKTISRDVEAILSKATTKTAILAEDVKKLLIGQAFADPNELSGWQIGACRYCWGDGNRYQRTVSEIERDRETFETKLNRLLESCDPKDKEKADRMGEFDVKGGIGWDPRKEPNLDCCECFGEGTGRPFVKDTRLLSDEARALYAGIDITDKGIKLKTNSQDSARMTLAKHYGILKDQLEISFDFSGLTLEEHELFLDLLGRVKAKTP